ncbi:MAG: Gfo/Idh/MocA family oxidoreductase [Proteobacteria bacterium]|nr:Gfo/Idh/MocA family oxidoreductase [Pseudomonadota bacterium]
MQKLKTAVIGVGYLGKFHAQKYAALPNSQLIAVCDIQPEHAQSIAKQLNVTHFTDYRALAGLVDAVSIVTPTPAHHGIARFFLEQGTHVLLEKPIAVTLAEADDLINLAHNNQLVLQIGHIERFNNVIAAVIPMLKNPIFIESTRLAPFKLRGSEVSVILDMMIHDIDLIQSMVESPIHEISAIGKSVLSSSIDIANARITFRNGCVANITASRINMRISRRLHIFQHDALFNLDLQHKKLTIQRKADFENLPGIPAMKREKISFKKDDPLYSEIAAFLNSILEKKPPLVSGADGRQALQTALKIHQIIDRNVSIEV